MFGIFVKHKQITGNILHQKFSVFFLNSIFGVYILSNFLEQNFNLNIVFIGENKPKNAKFMLLSLKLVVLGVFKNVNADFCKKKLFWFI